jgi:hypothetical protein
MSQEIELVRTNAKRDLSVGLRKEKLLVKKRLGLTADEHGSLIDAIDSLIKDRSFRSLVAQNVARQNLIESLP